MIFTDTHTHLYAAEFDTDREELMKRAIDTGVSRFFFQMLKRQVLPQCLTYVNGFRRTVFL